MHVIAKRLASRPQLTADWNAPPWNAIQAEKLVHFMGEQPAHMPLTEFKIAYDEAAVYVIFRVEDQYVRAVAKEHQDCVCADSCVEFFFAPVDDVTKGYFNLEMNCGGTMLFHFQTIPRENQTVLPQDACEKVSVAHSLPHIVEPEIKEPTTWTVAYRMPISILQEYCDVIAPAPGAVWRANFFKCADDTSQAHWLTWAPVDRPKPDFHRPESFATLEFE